jgi:ABC-type transport system substrate-binding protein
MSMAVDRQSIIDVLLGGRGCPSYLFTTDACSPFFQDKWKIPFDIDGAKALLTEAGFPSGFEFTFFIPTGLDTTREEIGLALVPMWEAIGLDVTVEKAAYSARRPTMLDRTISDAWIFGHVDAQLRESYVSMMDFFTTRRVWNPGYEYDRAREFEDELKVLVQQDEADAVIENWLQWISDLTPDIQIASYKVPWAVGPGVESWPLQIHAGSWPSELHKIRVK